MDIQSAINGNVWPAIPSAQDAILVALQYQLDKSQWLTAEQIRQHQLRQAQHLLAHAVTTIPYYKNTFSACSAETMQNMDWVEWQKLPILKRKDVQENSQNLISSTIPQDHLPVGAGLTSGSTGRPISLLRTRVTSQMWDAFTLRSHLWYQRDLSKKRAAIRFFESGVADAPAGAMQRGWGTAADMFLPHGSVVALNISTSLRDQAAWLLQQSPDYLISYPSNLAALADYCRKAGIRFPNLKEIATMGELLSEEQRDICREVFGLEILDTYSAEEIGYIALQCPSSLHYHVQSENVLLEVLNEQGQACQPDEIGRVVLTTLHNFAKPLIRYEIGDYAEVGETCTCGRGLPVLTKVMGRARNMFQKPNGELFWPTTPTVSNTYMHFLLAIRQVQYVQKSPDWIQINVVANEVSPEGWEADFIMRLHQLYGYPYKITFNYMTTILSGRNGKFEEFLNEVIMNG